MNVKLHKIGICMSKLAIYAMVVIQSIIMAMAIESEAQRKLLEEIPIYLTSSSQARPLIEVITEIEAKGDFTFAYSKGDVKKKSVLLLSEEWTMESLMKEISVQGQFSIRRVNETITLNPVGGTSLPDVMEQVSAQQTVSGTITDENGEPLPGATIQEKGTTNGTITNVEGQFTLSVPADAVLTVSFVGYETQELSLNGRSVLDVRLATDVSSLEEVVVVGYGTQKKSDIVGSVVSISKERLEQNANPNIFQALQGAAPGLSIQRSNGEPGTSGSIQVRGLNSISASNEPLIVLDGIPFAGNIRDLNPNDIASVEILKDASASAIYGSRAASGVILITTKRGEKETVIELNSSWSFQNEAVKYELMDPDKFYEIRRLAYELDGLLSGVAEGDVLATILEQNELISFQNGETVDWMSEMLNENALRQDYQVSIRTGNENIKEYFSVSFMDEAGLEQSTGFSRITLQNNLELTSITDWLTVGDNFSLSINDYERRVGGLSGSTAYYRLSPYARIFNEDGTYTIFPQANDNLHRNPVAENVLTSRENKFKNLFNNIYVVISPGFAEGLSFTSRLGSTFRNTFSGIYYPAGTFLGDALDGSAEVSNSERVNLTWENILNYNTSFGNHNIDLTALYSQQHETFESSTASASGFVSDDYLWHNLAAGAVVGTPGTMLDEWDILSYMFRAVYNFNEKYYLTATGRRDGYSGFGAGNKYGFFPSVALAWRISEEGFINTDSWLDDLKIRGSYGSVGNQAVGTFNSLARLTNAQHYFGEELTAGLRVSSLANTDLGWETTNTLNLAVDFATFEGRLSGTLEFYNSITNDILLNRQIPKTTGQDNITFNIGKVKNTGVEVLINTIPVVTDNFQWRIDLNFFRNQNEILDLFGDKKDDVANNWFIGEPLGVYFDYEFDGIWQLGQESEIANSATPSRSPGDARLVDQNDDGILDAEDRVIVGYQQPDWSGGISSTFTYQGLSLNIFIQTVQGRDSRLSSQNNNRFGRVNDPPYDFWTPTNPSNTWVKPGINNGLFYGSMDIYDASFWRIKDITLAYTLPETIFNSIGIKRAKVFANLHDYFTFTKFPYIDPESASTYQISIPKYVQFGFNVTL